MSNEHQDKKARTEGEDPAVSRFRAYLRINTMQPTPDYASCTAFLKREVGAERRERGRNHALTPIPVSLPHFSHPQAEEIGLGFRTWEGKPGKPVVILTWPGTNPALPSVVLNSHTDVVPVFEVVPPSLCSPHSEPSLTLPPLPSHPPPSLPPPQPRSTGRTRHSRHTRTKRATSMRAARRT